MSLHYIEMEEVRSIFSGWGLSGYFSSGYGFSFTATGGKARLFIFPFEYPTLSMVTKNEQEVGWKRFTDGFELSEI